MWYRGTAGLLFNERRESTADEKVIFEHTFTSKLRESLFPFLFRKKMRIESCSAILYIKERIIFLNIFSIVELHNRKAFTCMLANRYLRDLDIFFQKITVINVVTI
jgi:hypothetical protein